MQAYDVVMIGAGHNGLVCAAYLLKAGYSVLLLDKNSIPRGAATTEEALPQEAPGFKFNPCAIDHIFIHLGPIVQELELSKYGLEYLFCDPMLYVEKVLVDEGRAVGVRLKNGTEYLANRGVISSIDAKRLFVHLMDASDVDAADPELRDRANRRILISNSNRTQIKNMLCRNLMFSLRERIVSIVLQDCDTPKHPSECFLNPPCGCSNPGKDLQCEECPHLEACLSRFKAAEGVKGMSKLPITTNTKH